MISAAAVVKTSALGTVKRYDADQAYLFFSILWLFLEVAYFVIHMLGLNDKGFLERLPMRLIVTS